MTILLSLLTHFSFPSVLLHYLDTYYDSYSYRESYSLLLPYFAKLSCLFFYICICICRIALREEHFENRQLDNF